MKHQQVTVDFTSMVFTACSYLALAGAVWILLRLVQACFWLPRHLKKQNNVQRMLQEKVESYEKYILDCEEKEKAMMAAGNTKKENCVPTNEEQAEKWKERRECLEMLKRELRKVQDGDTSYDWEHLLDDNDDDDDDDDDDKEDGDTKEGADAVLSNRDANETNSQPTNGIESNNVDLDGLDYSDTEPKKDK